MDGGGAAVAARVVLRALSLAVVGAVAALAAAPAARVQEPSVVYVVRHAERAGEMGADPALSLAGEERARALAAALADAHVSAIVVTHFRRTQLTAAPLARALGLSPLVVPVGSDVPAHARAVADTILRWFTGRTVLVVGHSNTVAPIIAALGGPAIVPPCDNAFGDLWVLVRRGSGEVALARTRYGAADPPPPADCGR